MDLEGRNPALDGPASEIAGKRRTSVFSYKELDKLPPCCCVQILTFQVDSSLGGLQRQQKFQGISFWGSEVSVWWSFDSWKLSPLAGLWAAIELQPACSTADPHGSPLKLTFWGSLCIMGNIPSATNQVLKRISKLLFFNHCPVSKFGLM